MDEMYGKSLANGAASNGNTTVAMPTGMPILELPYDDIFPMVFDPACMFFSSRWVQRAYCSREERPACDRHRGGRQWQPGRRAGPDGPAAEETEGLL